MAYQISIQEKSHYLHVDVSGKRRPGHETEDGLTVWRQLAVIAKEKEFTRILYVARLTGKLSTIAAYSTSNALETTGLDKSYRLAFVDLNAESLKQNEFGETVIYNRGWNNARTFNDEASALRWLLSDLDLSSKE